MLPAKFQQDSQQASRQADKEVDARGRRCPMPLLLARAALADMEEGQLLRLQATDPGSKRDITLFARQCGHRLEAAWCSEDVLTYLLRKGR